MGREKASGLKERRGKGKGEKKKIGKNRREERIKSNSRIKKQ